MIRLDDFNGLGFFLFYFVVVPFVFLALSPWIRDLIDNVVDLFFN